MGSFSIWHWLIVLLVVMLIFGTKKLRNIGSDVGGAVKGFKEAMNEGKNAVDAERHDQQATEYEQGTNNLIEGNAVDASSVNAAPKKKAPAAKKPSAAKAATAKSTATKPKPVIKTTTAKPKAATAKKSNS